LKFEYAGENLLDKQSRIGEIVFIGYPHADDGEPAGSPALILSDKDIDGLNMEGHYIAAPITEATGCATSGEFSLKFNTDDMENGSLKPAELLVWLDKAAPLEEGRILQNNTARLSREKTERALKLWARVVTKSYYKAVHQPAQTPGVISDKTRISYAGRVFDEEEMINLVDSSLDFWLTTGAYAKKFENAFAAHLGVKYCSLTNSGSSANLLAFTALTSPKLEKRRIARGDEVITVAAAFPTTVAPIVQYGAIPVFVDVSLPTYNIDCSGLENALSDKTKAVMLAHTLGNPFDLETVKSFCDKHGLWLIEDNCDALGSKYFYKDEWKYTGTIGHLGTSSFYPPHHMTMGEGGAVYTNDPELKRIIESFRDWGRDCWCASGHDDTCRKRFQWQLGELPYGYDHKYVYSHFGYNLKVTDMQAAIGCAQLEKLQAFISLRKRNWQLLRDGLLSLSDRFIMPEAAPFSDPSWFGFTLTVREDAGFTRDEIVTHLESKGIQTRMLFAGNLIKHPCFDEMRKSGVGFRIAGTPPATSPSSHCLLPVTDRIMESTFWVGVYPGLSEAMIEYVVARIREFANHKYGSP
jgi:CDP-4-dehydro-6-deoxyglucose reductase, E1